MLLVRNMYLEPSSGYYSHITFRNSQGKPWRFIHGKGADNVGNHAICKSPFPCSGFHPDVGFGSENEEAANKIYRVRVAVKA